MRNRGARRTQPMLAGFATCRDGSRSAERDAPTRSPISAVDPPQRQRDGRFEFGPNLSSYRRLGSAFNYSFARKRSESCSDVLYVCELRVEEVLATSKGSRTTSDR